MHLQMSSEDHNKRNRLISAIPQGQTPHEILQLDNLAGYDEAKTSYRRIALLVHPDKALGQEAHDAFHKAKEAMQSFHSSCNGQER